MSVSGLFHSCGASKWHKYSADCIGKAFEVLMGEMQKVYNPPPEKKKSGWFSWGK